MAKHYTNSKGEKVAIDTMPYPHLKAAHAKAVRAEERRHEDSFQNGGSYENKEREAEIDAMAAEIARRDEAHASEALAEADEDGRGPPAED